MNGTGNKRISVEKLYKTFRIGCRGRDGALYRMLQMLTYRGPNKKIRVIDDVSLEVGAGETVGIIGCNGSGKSTLLRLIAGIYAQDSGRIRTSGQMVYTDGYGLGLKNKLSVRDNIYLAGILRGMERIEIKKRFGQILSFAELDGFANAKLYQLSSGMRNRLSFSITLHSLNFRKPEIIMLDEVFGSGGDLAFQNKAVVRMEELIKGGATVLMVSHDLELIKKYCSRTVLLDKGRKAADGRPEEVIAAYQRLTADASV